MKHLLITFATIFLLSCSGGDKQDDQHIYWVNSMKVPSEELAPKQCLQVQKADALDPAAWLNFSASIKGFDYQPGYIYKIVVKETRLDQADASSIEYTLMEILEKKQDMKMRINHMWIAEVIKGETLAVSTDELTLPCLEIHMGEMRYTGSDGCNNYMGGIIELNEHTLRFDIAAGTRKMCIDMTNSDLFNTTLPKVESWEIKDNKLHLFNADCVELMQLRPGLSDL